MVERKIDNDIISQIKRAKVLLSELEISSKKELSKKLVSEETKNLTQEVILKIRHVLDQAFYRFYRKHIFPKLTAKYKKAARRVYFPVVDKKEVLKSKLETPEMGYLKTNYPDCYNFLDSVQPYNKDFLWLKYLAYFAREKHIRLTPQTKTEIKRMEVSTEYVNASMPIENPNFSIYQGTNAEVKIGGVPVKFTKGGIIPLARGLKTKIITWVSFQFEGTEINSLWLCKEAVKKGERIIEELFSFI
jgi:hypothetical protein